MKKVILIIFVAILAGCNSTDDQQGSTAQNSTTSNTVCRQEKQIGTNMRRTVCRTKAQIEKEKKEAELAQREIRRQVGGDINEALRNNK